MMDDGVRMALDLPPSSIVRKGQPMPIDPHRITFILRKELLEIRQQRGLLLSMVFLPLLFTLMPLAILYIAGHVPPKELNNMPSSADLVKLYPALAGLSDQELAQAVIGPPLS